MFFMARHPVYGRISLAEPKQEITRRYGTDTGTLGVVSQTLEETDSFCRLSQSNGEEIDSLHCMAKRLRLLEMEDS